MLNSPFLHPRPPASSVFSSRSYLPIVLQTSCTSNNHDVMSLRVRQEEDLRWIDCEFDAQHALHMTDSGKRRVDEVGCALCWFLPVIINKIALV
ncbi:hypothetical protein C4D60_Mb10t07320 [Musa balbisiana]|uniref:Uncharacterized protein n=1 Tax=Musa balbisiana TaxID=52838 RepID=A0A4S8IW59_MUSBA|nr:hypothetical protein C4D60_Mb10t07320 [Musa balbisiana]